MKLTNLLKSALIAVTVCALPVHAFADEAEIMITGSTTVLPVMQSAGEAFMAVNPDIFLTISGGGSGNGIKALNEGLCEIAMSSRDIKPSEVEQARAKGVEPFRIPVAVDALVPVVHSGNQVKELSLDQLRAVYAGEITNWSQLGGADLSIVVISRDTSSGTFETWEEIVMRGAKVFPGALLQASNGAVAQAVAGNPRAIGYIGFGYLTDSLNKLDVNGIEATAESALSKTWPIARELYIFTNGQPEGNIKKLVAYLLDPQKGQRAVAETGFIPLGQ